MTLPKAISDAIDEYRLALLFMAGGEASGDDEVTRAALERAIAEHVADAGKMVSVAAPTEAEIEAWKVCAMGWSVDKAKEPPILQPQPDDVGKDGEAFLVVRSEIEEAVALMRQAAAAKKLMECQFGDIGSSKHARYEVYTTPVLGWSVGEPLPNLSVEVDGKVTRYVPEKQGGQ